MTPLSDKELQAILGNRNHLKERSPQEAHYLFCMEYIQKSKDLSKKSSDMRLVLREEKYRGDLNTILAKLVSIEVQKEFLFADTYEEFRLLHGTRCFPKWEDI